MAPVLGFGLLSFAQAFQGPFFLEATAAAPATATAPTLHFRGRTQAPVVLGRGRRVDEDDD